MHWLVRCSDETVCSLCRDELMAKVGGGMEEDAGRGGDPSIGRRRHVLREVKNKPIRNHTLLCVWLLL